MERKCWRICFRCRLQVNIRRWVSWTDRTDTQITSPWWEDNGSVDWKHFSVRSGSYWCWWNDWRMFFQVTLWYDPYGPYDMKHITYLYYNKNSNNDTYLGLSPLVFLKLNPDYTSRVHDRLSKDYSGLFRNY